MTTLKTGDKVRLLPSPNLPLTWEAYEKLGKPVLVKSYLGVTLPNGCMWTYPDKFMELAHPRHYILKAIKKYNDTSENTTGTI